MRRCSCHRRNRDSGVGSRESGIAEKVSPKRYRDTRVARWVEVARFVLKAVAVGAVLPASGQVRLDFEVTPPASAGPGEWWALVRVAAAGELLYSPAVRGMVHEEKEAEYLEKGGFENTSLRSQHAVLDLTSFTPGKP